MKLFICLYVVPFWPLWWLLTACFGRRLKGSWPPAREITYTLNRAIYEEWHGIP